MQVNLKTGYVSEARHKGQVLCDSTYLNVHHRKPAETESRSEVVRGWGRECRGLLTGIASPSGMMEIL